VQQGGKVAQENLPRVLVAGTREAIDIVQLAVGARVQVLRALSVEEALEQLGPGVQLVVCDVRFDKSRMFDFLGALKAGPCAALPVISLRAHYSALATGMHRSIELALGALGVTTFVDLPVLAAQSGMEAAIAALRDAVLSALPGPPAAHAAALTGGLDSQTTDLLGLRHNDYIGGNS
jgi:hypothetical protein